LTSCAQIPAQCPEPRGRAEQRESRLLPISYGPQTGLREEDW
jgi:hypothetical protein